MLAFSAAPVTAVHVRVDDEALGKAVSVGGSLYVLNWDPSLYSAGLHTITVKVEVNEGCTSLNRAIKWNMRACDTIDYIYN